MEMVYDPKTALEYLFIKGSGVIKVRDFVGINNMIHFNEEYPDDILILEIW